MSACAFVRRLEDREAVKSGTPVPVARLSIARRLRIAPGTLENLRRNRVKEPRASIVDKIRRALVDELEREIQALTHEVELLRATGMRPDADEIFQAETLLAQARKLLGKG